MDWGREAVRTNLSMWLWGMDLFSFFLLFSLPQSIQRANNTQDPNNQNRLQDKGKGNTSMSLFFLLFSKFWINCPKHCWPLHSTNFYGMPSLWAGLTPRSCSSYVQVQSQILFCEIIKTYTCAENKLFPRYFECSFMYSSELDYLDCAFNPYSDYWCPGHMLSLPVAQLGAARFGGSRLSVLSSLGSQQC